MSTVLPELLQSLLHPPLPTPEPVRREMRSDGWILTLEAKERRKYYEMWSFSYCKGKWGKLDLSSHLVARVEGNLETVLQGLVTLTGKAALKEKGAISDA